MNSNTELGEFLKVRRALVSPAGDGGPRRRVPGLRREEVALGVQLLQVGSVPGAVAVASQSERALEDRLAAARAGELLLDPARARQRVLHLSERRQRCPAVREGRLVAPRPGRVHLRGQPPA